ncbi:ACT domain-containing protein, partial [Gardnerella vaginalis]
MNTTNHDENKAVITVVGKDAVGIIAKVTSDLASRKANILDISQTIVNGFFNMMMIVDVNEISVEFGELAEELAKLGEEIGVR